MPGCFIFWSWDAVTAIAAVFGLGAVGFQLHWLRKQMRLQLYGDYTRRYQEIALNFPERVNESSFLLSKLPEEERAKTMRFMRAYFDLCFEEWDLNNSKLIDADFWRVWEGGMKFAFSKPAFKQAWATIRTDSRFGRAFETFVDESMSERS